MSTMSENHPDNTASPSPEEEFIRARQMQGMRTLGALADGIAQNLGDLLRSVKVQLQTTREDIPDDHVTQDYLSQSLNDLSEIESLVERLLVLNKTGTGDEEKEVNLTALVKELLPLIESSFPAGFTLRTRFDGDCRVTGAPSQLQQLVANLVTNAGVRMEGQEREQPTVLDVSVQTVAADPALAGEYLDIEPGHYVHVAVSNTAEGSPRSERAASGTTTAVHGDDPYLSVAHGIVEGHGGKMTVRQEPDEGITYNVYLPSTSEHTETPTPKPDDPSGPERGQRVLVIDDDTTVLKAEDIRLSQLGYEVVAKSNASEALALVREFPSFFDATVVDYHMPETNGLELVHAMREAGCEASVILMTGLSAQISEAKARVVGIDHILRKPVESGQLSDLLTELTN